jgi:hypothetical protein
MAVGASTWASGSQVWNGNMGTYHDRDEIILMYLHEDIIVRQLLYPDDGTLHFRLQQFHEIFSFHFIQSFLRKYFSFFIFSWILISASVKASGLGGHPGRYTSTGIILSTPLKMQ